MNKLLCEYSPAERKLIAELSPHWAKTIDEVYITPTFLYNHLAVECFLSARDDSVAAALRRVLQAINKSSVWRMTQEFDRLCEF